MDEKEKNGEIRDEKGRFIAGKYEGGPGRPKDTESSKIKKKAIKQLVAEYKEGLANALSEISPILLGKAKAGDIQAIKEIHEIIVEKAVRKQDLTSGGKPIPLLGGLSNVNGNNGNSEIADADEED